MDFTVAQTPKDMVKQGHKLTGLKIVVLSQLILVERSNGYVMSGVICDDLGKPVYNCLSSRSVDLRNTAAGFDQTGNFPYKSSFPRKIGLPIVATPEQKARYKAAVAAHWYFVDQHMLIDLNNIEKDLRVLTADHFVPNQDKAWLEWQMCN